MLHRDEEGLRVLEILGPPGVPGRISEEEGGTQLQGLGDGRHGLWAVLQGMLLAGDDLAEEQDLAGAHGLFSYRL